MTVLPQRFEAYGRTLHPEKTRLVAFKRPDAMALPRDDDNGPDEPGTFDFLGFTIYWAKSPMTGTWVVKTQTANEHFRRTMRSITQWCKTHRHEPLPVQQRALGLKLCGHYGYYGRKGNRARLWRLDTGSCRCGRDGCAATPSAASPGTR